MPISRNIKLVAHQVGQYDKRLRFGHDGAVLWLTGLSGSGKSTLAMGLEAKLSLSGYACYALDGDNVRHGLNADLGFSAKDRSENIRRIGEIAALFADAGLICITAFISPYVIDREKARAAAYGTSFHEIYVAADLATCERRDPKGLYQKARAGDLHEFTGIDAPYEPPLRPDLTIDSANQSVGESIALLLNYVTTYLPRCA